MSAMPSLATLMIAFCIGVGANFAWQSHRDAAREMIANSYPQLGWLAPQPAPTAQNALDVVAQAAPAGTPPDQQQLNPMSLEDVRQSADRIAASVAAGQEEITHSVDRIAPRTVADQEQITRSIDRIAASQERLARRVEQFTLGQEQMMGKITKLHEIAQYILNRNSEPPPRPAPAMVPGPVPRPSQAPAVR